MSLRPSSSGTFDANLLALSGHNLCPQAVPTPKEPAHPVAVVQREQRPPVEPHPLVVAEARRKTLLRSRRPLPTTTLDPALKSGKRDRLVRGVLDRVDRRKPRRKRPVLPKAGRVAKESVDAVHEVALKLPQKTQRQSHPNLRIEHQIDSNEKLQMSNRRRE